MIFLCPFKKFYRTPIDLNEKLVVFGDCAEAAISGDHMVGGLGHNGNPPYFLKKDKQLAEVIAAASEAYWGESDELQRLAPEFYKELCEFMRKHMRRR